MIFFRQKQSIDHNCYNDRGQSYRGTASQTQSGAKCLYWSQQIFLRTSEYPELTGHNYCRNPGGREEQPWCYVHDFRKEFCDIPKCFDQYLWFYIISPVVCALILFIILVCVCCIRRRRRIVSRRNRALLDDHNHHHKQHKHSIERFVINIFAKKKRKFLFSDLHHLNRKKFICKFR